MQFTVAKSALLEALQICSSAVPGKSTLPILQNFLLTAQNGELLVTATDLDLGVRMAIAVDLRQAGDIVVPARSLVDIVRELPDLPVEFAVKDFHLVIRSEGGFSCRLAGVDAAEFPALPVLEDEGGFTIPSGVMRNLSDRTLFAVSNDQTRLSLNGVYWEPQQNGRMAMVATDGHRLGFATAESSEGGLTHGVIVPPKAINQVLRVAVGDETLIDVHLADGSARFRSGVVEIFTKLIEGPYPNYGQVVPKASARAATVHRDEFASIVRRVATLANRNTRQVRLSFAPGRLEVSAQNLDLGGEGRDSVSVEYAGEPFDIGFNAAYLLEILKLIETPQVRLKMNQPTQACVLEPALEAPENFFILMPLRLSD
ncbi:MAG: DNA polymerase III subunit beta [Fibrobacteria bacterium]|nr:DNA polymerase III subunit beta [Fibrobacteria bacterium]